MLGEEATYKIQVLNQGEADAAGVAVQGWRSCRLHRLPTTHSLTLHGRQFATRISHYIS